MQRGVTNFDGSTILSSWISKDFNLGFPFNFKTFNEGIWVEAERVVGSSATVSYSLGRTGSFTEKTLDLAVSSITINRRIQFDDSYLMGKSVRVKFGNSILDNRFKIFSYELPYSIDSLRRDPDE